MSLFSTTASIEETKNVIYRVAKGMEYQKLEEKEVQKNYDKEICFRNEKLNALLKAKLKETKSGCLFKLTFSPDRAFSKKITLLILLLSIWILTGLLVANDLFSSLNINIFSLSFFFGLLIYSIWLFKIYLNPISRGLKNQALKFNGEMENHIIKHLIYPTEIKVIKDWQLVLSLILFLILGAYIASFAKIIFPVFIVLELFMLCGMFMDLATKNAPKLRWKAIIIGFITRWETLLQTLILLFLWIYLVNALINFGYQKSQNKNIEFKSIINSFIYLPNLKKNSLDPIKENRLLLDKIIDIQSEKIKDNNKKKQLLALDLLLISGFVVFAIIQTIIYYKLFRIMSDWKTYTDSKRLFYIKSPPISEDFGKKSIWLYIYVFVGYIIAVIINWFILLLAIDAIAFAFTEKTILFKGWNILFAWIPAIISSISNVLNLANDNFAIITSKIIILWGYALDSRSHYILYLIIPAVRR